MGDFLGQSLDEVGHGQRASFVLAKGMRNARERRILNSVAADDASSPPSRASRADHVTHAAPVAAARPSASGALGCASGAVRSLCRGSALGPRPLAAPSRRPHSTDCGVDFLFVGPFETVAQTSATSAAEEQEVLLAAARQKGWFPFVNESSGEEGFLIPEAPDSVVYASPEQGAQQLPRADEWLRNRAREVPHSLEAHLRPTPVLATDDGRAVAEDEDDDLRRSLEARCMLKADEEALTLRVEDLRLHVAKAAEAERRRLEEEGEARRRHPPKEELVAEEGGVEEPARRGYGAKTNGAGPRSLAEAWRLGVAERERLRAQHEADVREHHRRMEAGRYLRKEHGKLAFAYLAHEGPLDRQVWDRPDDEAKRLGQLNSYHVASGGTGHGSFRAQEHVHALETAVHDLHPEVAHEHFHAPAQLLTPTTAGGGRSSLNSSACSSPRWRPPTPRRDAAVGVGIGAGHRAPPSPAGARAWASPAGLRGGGAAAAATPPRTPEPAGDVAGKAHPQCFPREAEPTVDGDAGAGGARSGDPVARPLGSAAAGAQAV